MFSMACTHFCLFFVVVVDLQTCQFLRTTQATLSCLQTQISCSSPRTMMTLVISTTSSMFQFSNLVTMVLLYCVLLCFQLSISLMPSTGHLNQTRRNHRQRYSNCYLDQAATFSWFLGKLQFCITWTSLFTLDKLSVSVKPSTPQPHHWRIL